MDVATMTNGRIPPSVDRVTLIRVCSHIGRGVADDPIRIAVSYYDEDGNHKWTFDDGKMIARNGFDALAKEPK